jgi:ABC-type xylose transport system substrate-binding protein
LRAWFCPPASLVRHGLKARPSAFPGRTSRKSAGSRRRRHEGAIEANGDTYISTDAQSSAAKQLSDVESLMAQGVDALIVLAQDTQAIIPAVQAAADEGIPVIAYDRLIEDSRAFYLTFDNVEVGRMQARAVSRRSRRATT